MVRYAHSPYDKYDGRITHQKVRIRTLQITYLHCIRKKEADEIFSLTHIDIDKIYKAIESITEETVEKAVDFFEKDWPRRVVNAAPNKPTGYCAYVVEFFNSKKERVFLKVGMTKDWEKRGSDLLGSYPDFDIQKIVSRFFINADNEDDALTMENTLRKYYKELDGSNFLPKDRFIKAKFNERWLKNNPMIRGQYEFLGYSFED